MVCKQKLLSSDTCSNEKSETAWVEFLVVAITLQQCHAKEPGNIFYTTGCLHASPPSELMNSLSLSMSVHNDKNKMSSCEQVVAECSRNVFEEGSEKLIKNSMC
ncbi:hypothetical protein ANN_28028 [Periplaneta americana]|uniref:Uncharacterized protein n=1 Tax=Periplaneta americana TaxID=6978 RepID=A0ABQ8RUJ5_PERAM|nr:hypothetical protein ANN_28028 [Periplaneta americana]